MHVRKSVATAEAAEADMNQLGMDPPKLCKLGLDV